MTKRAKILWGTSAMGLLTVTSGIYAALTYWDWPLANAEAGQARVAYVQAGLPMSDEDLHRPFDLQEGACQFLPQLELELARSEVMESRFFWRKMSQGEYGELNQRMAGKALELGRLAAQQVHLGRSHKLRFLDDNPAIRCLREGSERLAQYALVESGLNKRKQAVEDFRASVALVQLGQERMRLNDCVALWFRESECYEMMAYAAVIGRKDPHFLKALRQLTEIPMISGLESMLRAECWIGLKQLESPEESSLDADEQTSTSRNRARVVRYLQLWTQALPLIEAHKNDWGGFESAWSNFHDEIADRRGRSWSDVSDYMPWFYGFANMRKRVGAAQLVARAMIDSLLFKLKTGRFPTSLNELTGNWSDPFSNTLLRLERKTGRYLIYSVDYDRVDNGGTSHWQTSTIEFDLAANCDVKP